MNQSIVQYLRENKGKYPKDDLVARLRQTGYPENDIVESLGVIYDESNVANPPLPANLTVKYAGFWVRCAAILLDSFVIGAIILVLKFVFSVDLEVSPFVFYLYFIGMTYFYQATLGKMAVGIRVVSETGERLHLGKIFLREFLGRLVSSITLNIGYIVVAFTKKKQGIHDFLSGSIVVYVDAQEKRRLWIVVAFVVGSLLCLLIVFGMLFASTFFGLEKAREKAKNASIRSNIATLSASAPLYYDLNGTYAGFVPDSNRVFPECSGDPVIHISDDGSSFAIFGKLCSQELYVCGDENGISEKMADEEYVKRNTQCP